MTIKKARLGFLSIPMGEDSLDQGLPVDFRSRFEYYIPKLLKYFLKEIHTYYNSVVVVEEESIWEEIEIFS